MNRPPATALLVHICSFYRTSQVHERLFEHIHERFGILQLVIVPTKGRQPDPVRSKTSFGEVVQLPCLNAATSLSSLVRGQRIERAMAAAGLLDSLAGRPVSLIHAHSAYMDGFVAARLSERLGTPFALSFRMTDTRFCFRYRPHASFLMTSLVRRAAHLLVISHGDTARIAGRLDVPAERIDHLGSGVDDSYIEHATLCRQATGSDALIFMTTGKLGYGYKRVDLTIRACELAARQLGRTDWTLQVLGMSRDDYRTTYRRRPPAHPTGSVEFLGRIESRDAVRTLMRTASLFVLPSRETFGIADQEAISQCTPVVWLKDYGIDGEFANEHVGAGAVTQDAEAIASAMVSACTTNGGVLGPFEQNPVARLGWAQLAERYAALMPGIVTPNADAGLAAEDGQKPTAPSR